MSPNWHGGPDVIRTRDPQFRKLMLYPAELRDLPCPLYRGSLPKEKARR